MTAATTTVRKSEPSRFTLSLASLCSLAIAFWGWHTGLWFVAVPMALLLEARRALKQRWELSANDLKEVGKLSVAILLMLLVVLMLTERSLFIYGVLQWLPVAAFPLVMAQTYGVGVLDILRDVFSNPYLLRQGIRRKRNPLNLYYPYFVLCLLAASAADSEDIVFYAGVTALGALLLWTLRPQRSVFVVWALLFGLAAGLGFVGHVQLSQFQQRLEAQVIAMLGDLASGSVDPEGTATRMGSLGRLKLSGRIAFRVAPSIPVRALGNGEKDGQETAAENGAESGSENGSENATESGEKSVAESVSESDRKQFPLLLREATYNEYKLSIWRAENSLFAPSLPGEDDGGWILAPTGEQAAALTISTDLERGDGVLTLPHGSTRIRQLPVEEMQQNQYGAVQVDAKGNVAYQVQFDAGFSRFGAGKRTNANEAPPTPMDLQIPKVDQAAVAQALDTLALAGKSDLEKVRAIAAYFQDFTYSLDLLRPSDASSPVSDFLLKTRAGHCEYFASATALLLRGAGIPARYAVGYSVHEFSPLERQYIVRSRDAHAWTLFYLGGQWHTLDTTPPDWTVMDREKASSFQRVGDVFSFLGFQVSLRIRQFRDMPARDIILLMLPAFGYLVWRSLQAFQGRRTTPTALTAEASKPVQLGLDSEFYQIEQRLEQWLSEQNLERLPSESLWQWRSRLEQHLPAQQWASLKEILTLHYRYRFDPQPLNTQERQQLSLLCQQWLKTAQV